MDRDNDISQLKARIISLERRVEEIEGMMTFLKARLPLLKAEYADDDEWEYHAKAEYVGVEVEQ